MARILRKGVIADYDAWLADVVGPDQVGRLRETLHLIIGSPRRERRASARAADD
ncbi:hypothetical protein Acsp06_51480 [Actinomycetospora sp. NBRC 106375]|uniref:hypothetical protein n=1 Tax=Actinomycetospora sp. NBRC 106375 TaxID=3032207 RepID=UPI0024A1B9F2|nr:hypothetical protein [Actinomycetospora sp. NBRC 106375]GLZ48963.1 hypothetical protein Acsp06_51480 [Actinomycetospora sp. NBRC 106375]